MVKIIDSERQLKRHPGQNIKNLGIIAFNLGKGKRFGPNNGTTEKDPASSNPQWPELVIGVVQENLDETNSKGELPENIERVNQKFSTVL